MQELVSSVTLLVLLASWHNAVAVEVERISGQCIGLPDDDMLVEMIEEYSSIEIELVTHPDYVCTTASLQAATVGANFTCTGGELFCDGNIVGILYDIQCVDRTWSIVDTEFAIQRISDVTYENCTYCLTDEMRRERFPSRPDNSYQFIERQHCLCKSPHICVRLLCA